MRPAPPPIYPSPPAEARFIYDGTLRSSRDVESPSFWDKLHAAAVGASIEPEGMAKPYGIVVKDQRVYVTDTQQRSVVVFDMKNGRFFQFGTSGEGNLQKPLGISISDQNEIFVIDITALRIAIYDIDGNYLRDIDVRDDVRRPTGIAVSPDGSRIYLVDTGGIDSQRHRVLIYDNANGQLLKSFGKRGQQPGEFNLPLQIDVGPDGKVYIVDSANFRVQSFDADGNYLSSFGSIGRRAGQFSRPKGVAVDMQGNIYVSDTAFGNVQIFNPAGELLLHIGNRGTAGRPGRFMLPADVEVSDDGKIYVVDQFFRKIDIFRPASQPATRSLPKF